MRYAELTIVGSLVFAVAISIREGTPDRRPTGAAPRPEVVRFESAVSAKVDISTACCTALATVPAPEGDNFIVGARLVLEGGKPAWVVRIALPSQQHVTEVLIDGESGGPLPMSPESEKGRKQKEVPLDNR